MPLGHIHLFTCFFCIKKKKKKRQVSGSKFFVCGAIRSRVRNLAKPSKIRSSLILQVIYRIDLLCRLYTFRVYILTSNLAMAGRFDIQAQSYAEARPHYPPSLFSFLSSLTSHHHRAWDVATGNGQAAVGVFISFYCFISGN